MIMKTEHKRGKRTIYCQVSYHAKIMTLQTAKDARKKMEIKTRFLIKKPCYVLSGPNTALHTCTCTQVTLQHNVSKHDDQLAHYNKISDVYNISITTKSEVIQE